MHRVPNHDRSLITIAVIETIVVRLQHWSRVDAVR